ncbi:MAG: LPXTG cell wall anchor domain-containing protein [Clostridiales bacterium]|nr:LPXTG cell wall anchor domain-containing protein [Clostridiales bacterium]
MYDSSTSTSPLAFRYDSTSGVYYYVDTSQLTPTGNTNEYQNANGYTFTVTYDLTADSNGEITVKGLKDTEYYLEETATASSYYLLSGRFKVTLVSDSSNIAELLADDPTNGVDGSKVEVTDTDDTGLILSYGVDTTDKDILNTTIKNTTEPSLPATGGLGTILFTIGGVVLMIFAAWVFMNLCRLFAKYLN